MKINDSELENLIKSTNIEPSAQWQTMALENIKKGVTEKNNESINNSNLNFISVLMMKRKFAVLAVVLFALVAVIASTAMAIISLKLPNKALTDKQILEKISMNNVNYGAGVASSLAAGATRETYTTRDMASSKLIYPGYPFNSEFNYYYSKTTTTRGPAFNSCNYGMDQSEFLFVPVFESYSYSDSTSSYSKYLAYNTDNSLNSYSLSTSTQTQETYKYETITYLGGDYAVRNSGEYANTIVAPMDGSAEPRLLEMSTGEDSAVGSSVSSEELPATTTTSVNYFGDEAQVLRTETINGKDYYVVQSSYKTNCSGYVNPNRWDNEIPEDNRTIYTLTYASVDDYQILRTENYLDSVEANSLMESSETVSQNTNIDFESVSSNFKFEYNVPLKEITYESVTTVPEYNVNDDIQKAVEFAQTKNLSIVLPQGSATNEYVYLNHLSSEDAVKLSTADNYYADRSFYPAGEIGDKMFNTYNGTTLSVLTTAPASLGSVSYTLGDSTYNLSIYSTSDDSKKILNGMLWSEIRNRNESQVFVSINGEQVPATLYSFEINQPTILPYAVDSLGGVSVNESCSENCYQKQYVLIFSYNNNKYSLQEYLNTSTDGVEFSAVVDADFKAYSADNQSDLEQIRTIITNSLNGTYVNGTSGVDVPPSEPLRL